MSSAQVDQKSIEKKIKSLFPMKMSVRVAAVHAQSEYRQILLQRMPCGGEMARDRDVLPRLQSRRCPSDVLVGQCTGESRVIKRCHDTVYRSRCHGTVYKAVA